VGRAEDLFARIEAQGIAAIDELISSAAAEELFLDFKGTSDGGPNGTLNEADSKNLAKAISGFGNSEGGVIVWGVDSRPVNRGGGLQAPIKSPLAHAQGFRHRIEAALSRLSSPAAAGVRNHDIRDGQDTAGYVATLIPKADFSPVRAIVKGGDGYFVRAGDSFVSASHDTLAGMFGRKPLGKLHPQLVSHNVIARPPGPGRPSPETLFLIGFSLFNSGITILERPFISVHPLTEDTQRALFFYNRNRENFDATRSDSGNLQVYAVERVIIAPGAMLDICTLELSFKGSSASEAKIQITLGAANALPCRFELGCSAQLLTGAIAAAASGEEVSTSELFGFEDILRKLTPPL